MAAYLPAGITNRREYFHKTLRFLVRFEWLYNYPVTEILSSGLLDELPLEWWRVLQNLNVDEINRIPRGEFKDSWPVSLKQFIVTARRLRLPIADQPVPAAARIPERLRHALVRGMSPKKMHEVTRLAAVVAESCERAGVRRVVDMGCGLGYLCEALHFMFGLRVVGLESDPAKVARARERHASICRMLRVQDQAGVRYVECDVTDETGPVARALSQELDARGQPAPFCLIGLHSCGDLTPHAVHLFHRIEQITLFVLVTCCYHKMEVDERAEGAARCSAASAPATSTATADGEERSRRVERLRKARLVLQLLWGRIESGLALEDDLYGDETQRSALSAELAQAPWLGATGSLLAPRAPPAAEHFRKFPLSEELRALVPCGAARVPLAVRTLGSACSRRFARCCAPRVRGCSESCALEGTASPAFTLASRASDDAAADPRWGDACPGGSAADQAADQARGLWGCQFLRRPLLRLASNETAASWERRTGPEHESHSVHLMTRAVLQLYATRRGLSLAQRGACLLHNMQLGLGPREILADIVDRLLAPLGAEERQHHKRAVALLYAALDPLRPLLEAVTALQVSLQHVCEGLILVDRLAALSHRVPNVSIRRVADPYFSPRCYALVAEKRAKQARGSPL